MNQKILLILLAAACLLFVFGCTANPGDVPNQPGGNGGFGGFTPSSAIDLSGVVTDSSGNPISSVQVIVEGMNNSATTSASGWYQLKGISGEATGKKQTITFSKQGFVPIHKLLDIYSASQEINVEMFLEQAFEKVDPSKAVNAKMDGASLSSEANSFVVKGTGATATTANVSLTPFDPTNEKDLEAFPGDFEGVQKNGETTQIETFGFMKIQVKDDRGQALDLASGKTAEVVMPISPSQKDTAPDSIPLWYFDPNKGSWLERGTATKTCNNSGCYYKGQIDTIASWWNCDKGISDSGQIDPKLGFKGDFLECLAHPVDCFTNWYTKKTGDWAIFDKDFTNSNWRLLLDAASIFLPPVNWAYSTWILLNPHTSALEKAGAIVGLLPLMNANTGAHIAELMGFKMEGTALAGIETRGLSSSAQMVDSVANLGRAGAVEELRSAGMLERTAAKESAAANEVRTLANEGSSIGKESSVVQRDIGKIVDDMSAISAEIKQNMANEASFAERVAALKQFNELNNELAPQINSRFRQNWLYDEGGGIKYANGEGAPKLAIYAENFDQVMEAYSNPKVEQILKNMQFKLGTDIGVSPLTNSNSYKGITVYFPKDVTAGEYQSVAAALNEALEGYSGARTAQNMIGDLKLGENGVFGRWANGSNGEYVAAKYMKDDPFIYAPSDFKSVANELHSSMKPLPEPVPTVPAGTPSVPGAVPTVPSQTKPSIPSLAQATEGGASDLWVSKYAPALTDSVLMQTLVDGASDFFLQSAIQNTSLASSVISSSNSGFAINSSGEQVPLNSFNVIPLGAQGNDFVNSGGLDAGNLSGGQIVFNDVANSQGTENIVSSVMLSPVLLGSGAAITDASQTINGSVMFLSNGASAGDWLDARAQNSFTGAQDKFSALISKSQPLNFDNNKLYVIKAGMNQLISMDYGDVVKIYNNWRLVAEEHKSDSSLDKYYIYDMFGNLSKTMTKGVETNYSYNNDGSSSTVTTTLTDSGYSYTISYSFDVSTNTMTEINPVTGDKTVSKYDSNLDLIYSQATAGNTMTTYEYGPMQSKTTVEQKDSTGNITNSSITLFDKANNNSTTTAFADTNMGKTKVIIIEVYNSNNALLSRNGKYFTASGVDYVLQVEDNTIYSYTSGKLTGARETKTDSNGTVTNQDYSYDGSEASAYYDILKNDKGYITQISQKKNSDVLSQLASGLPLVDSISFEYDNLGRVSKEMRSDGITVEYIYDSMGNVIEARTSDGKVIHPMTDSLQPAVGAVIGSFDKKGFPIKAKLTLQGLDYQSRVEVLVTIDASGAIHSANGVPLLGKPGGQALLKLEINGVVSEGINVTVPEKGQSVNPVFNYGALVVPLQLADKNGYNSVWVSFIDEKSKTVSTQKYLSEKKSSDTIVFLLNPRQSGKIVVEGMFSNFKKEVQVGEVASGKVQILSPISIDSLTVFSPTLVSADFNCPAHYAYIQEVAAPADNNFTTDKTYDVLYYDGKQIDSSSSIDKVVLFGDSIAYEKEKYSTSKGDDCGDYYFYSRENSCTNRETHIIYNGSDLGKGQAPQIWANHLGFKNVYPQKGFTYDGKTYGSDCSYASYYLWGDNLAYSCDGGDKAVYWNGKNLGVGNIDGIHKGFLKVRMKDGNEFLFKNGEVVKDCQLLSPTLGCSRGELGVFGDNWWQINTDSSDKGGIYYNGKIIYEGEYPQIVIFGKEMLYGSYDELYFNGQKIATREENGGLLGNLSLVSGNYAFFVGNKKVNYGGKDFQMKDLHEGKLKLFGNNWLVSDSIGNGINEYMLFMNGKEVGRMVFDTAALMGDKLEYIDSSDSTQSFYGKLTYNGQMFDSNYESTNEYRIFGGHIYYSKRIDYPYNEEYFVDGKSIGMEYDKDNAGLTIKKFYAWPSMSPKTEFGTQNSNEYNLESYPESSFDSTYLYCTNQWK